MRLAFKSQSTFYTCVQATQAIALNSFLGTDYNDLEVIAALENGFPLNFSMIILGQDIVRSRFSPELPYDYSHHQLGEGILRALREQRTLPSFEEAVQHYIQLSIGIQQNYERGLRENPRRLFIGSGTSEWVKLTPEEVESDIKEFGEREAKGRGELERLVGDEQTRAFYNVYIQHLDKELLQPIGYHFEISYGTGFEAKFAGIRILSGGRLVVEPYDISLLEPYSTNVGILMFGAHRKDLGLPEHSSRAGHFWVVDKKESDKLVLLDTNHQHYGHAPEVYVPIQTLNALNQKEGISDPVLVHPK